MRGHYSSSILSLKRCLLPLHVTLPCWILGNDGHTGPCFHHSIQSSFSCNWDLGSFGPSEFVIIKPKTKKELWVQLIQLIIYKSLQSMAMMKFLCLLSSLENLRGCGVESWDLSSKLFSYFLVSIWIYFI